MGSCLGCVDFGQRSQEVVCQGGVRTHGSHVTTPDHHVIPTGLGCTAKKFSGQSSKPPLGPVARHRVANLFRAGESDARCALVATIPAQKHKCRCGRPTTTVHPEKVSSLLDDVQRHSRNRAGSRGIQRRENRRCHRQIRRSATSGPVPDEHSGSYGRLWSPYVHGTRGGAYAQGSKADTSASWARSVILAGVSGVFPKCAFY